MGGAANVMGLALMIMDAKLKIDLTVLVPVVENSISGNALRPGDIYKSRAGLTVQIDNTDAEGRLILADALALADEDEPELLIDPNKFSADGTSQLAAFELSRDGKHLAYGISAGGSDWRDVHVMEVASRKVLDDVPAVSSDAPRPAVQVGRAEVTRIHRRTPSDSDSGPKRG